MTSSYGREFLRSKRHTPDLRHQTGIGKLTALVFLTLFGAAFYVAYNVIPFYYYFFEIQNQMEAVIRVASVETDREIRRKLLYHIKKLELPVLPEDLKIERDGNFMRLSLPYQEVFYISYQGKEYDLWTFDFHAYAEGYFRGSGES